MTPPDPHPEWFAAFWAAYWRKRDKGHAEKAFWRICTSQEMLDRILAAIAQQTPEMLRRPKDRVPYPATWLNGKCWEDVGFSQDSHISQRVINCEKCADTGVVFTGRTGSVLRRCTCVVGLLPGELVGVSA